MEKNQNKATWVKLSISAKYNILLVMVKKQYQNVMVVHIEFDLHTHTHTYMRNGIRRLLLLVGPEKTWPTHLMMNRTIHRSRLTLRFCECRKNLSPLWAADMWRSSIDYFAWMDRLASNMSERQRNGPLLLLKVNATVYITSVHFP